MEPPQIAELVLFVLASVGLFALASYEATFTSLSKSSLERMHESGVRRAGIMLRIHERRHLLHLMARIGQALGVAILALSTTHFLLSFPLPRILAALVAGIASVAVPLIASLAGRVRFEEEGEEAKIPGVALLFVPIHLLLCVPARLVERVAHSDASDEGFKEAREAELRNIVDSEQETGVLEETERDMIQGVFGFHDRVVREVMVPRVDVTSLEISSSLGDLLRVIEERGHSRIPVFEESLDQIRGIVYAKDLLQMLVHRSDIRMEMSVADLMAEGDDGSNRLPFAHEPYYIPETKKIDELLRDLRTARTRLAIVVDEYGGTAGLVTTEDLVEEIVGELQDEYDAEEALFELRPDNTLVVNPRINIDELNELLESDLPSDGFDTLGGFIYDFLGEVPGEGQIVQIPGLDIEILKVEGQRIAQVQMKRVPIAPDVQEQEETATRR